MVKGLLDFNIIPDHKFDWGSSNMETSSNRLLQKRFKNRVDEIENVEDEEESSDQI